MPIVDTHCHVIDRSRVRYPWLAGVPGLNRDFPWPAYWREAEAAGIGAVLHMEVDAAAADAGAEVAMTSGFGAALVGVVAGCRPECASFAAAVEDLAAMPRVCGVRRVLHTVPDAVSQAPLFAENLRLLPALGLSFDLCVRADQLGVAAALVDACPDVRFVLDHCGNPPIAAGGLDAWGASIAGMARRPNVVCKLSGLVNHAGPGWTIADLRPVFDAVLASFGAERVVWGSDWPVCTLAASLSGWVTATHALLEGASVGERQAILGGNASRVYRRGA